MYWNKGFNYKHAIRHLIAGAFFATGITSSILRHRLHRKAIVLMYHRVVDRNASSEDTSSNAIQVSPDTFRHHMQYLKDNFNLLPISEFIHHLVTDEPFTDLSCLVTFDDGWLDNYENAFPILKEFQIPALIFLPTDFIGSNQVFWQERLSYLLKSIARVWRHTNTQFQMADNILPSHLIENLKSAAPNHCDEAISAYIASLKSTIQHEIEQKIDYLSYVCGTSLEQEQNGPVFMSWDHVREMSEAGISFGSHGVHHYILTVEEHAAEYEITSSKTIIQQALQHSVDAFSYPNGNYNQNISKLVQKAGYSVAFNTVPGYIDTNTDRFGINRTNIQEDMTSTLPLFAARLAAIW
jgi:peptidoglycan/xylan/chitin deacetylase (PgdA/CDA1 family)